MGMYDEKPYALSPAVIAQIAGDPQTRSGQSVMEKIVATLAPSSDTDFQRCEIVPPVRATVPESPSERGQMPWMGHRQVAPTTYHSSLRLKR